MLDQRNSQGFTVTLNGESYLATYAVMDGIVYVQSRYGTAAATAHEESNYATAITLFFGICTAPGQTDQFEQAAMCAYDPTLSPT